MPRRLMLPVVAAALIISIAAMMARARVAPDAPSKTPLQAALATHVTTLASPEFGGRAGVSAAKTVHYLIDRFRELGLEPLFEGSFEQPIYGFGAPAETVIGRNVGAVLRGADPVLRDEWIILSAHYDHLGNRDVLFPGADDNASGVAMMLEVARCIAQTEGARRPKRSIAFVGFDLEERGLWGSEYFVNHAPISLDRLKLFLTADMIGRSLGGVCDEYVFVMGTEFAPGLRPWLDDASRGLALKTGVVGSDLLLFDRSDYGPFRKRKIPYLFFSTGESPVYHTPDDRPETLDYPKLTEISGLVLKIVNEAARCEHTPEWAPKPDHPLSEAVVVREVLGRILSHADVLKISRVQLVWLKSQIDDLEIAIKRGALTPIERRRMLLNAQMLIYSVL